jgi:hypothetical protein
MAMKHASLVAVLASVFLSSCGPSAEENARATEEVARIVEEMAITLVAVTAEIESKVALAIEQTQTAQATSTDTATATATIIPSPSATQTLPPTQTATASPTHTPTATDMPTSTTTPSPTNTPLPTDTPTPVPTHTPLPAPTATATEVYRECMFYGPPGPVVEGPFKVWWTASPPFEPGDTISLFAMRYRDAPGSPNPNYQWAEINPMVGNAIDALQGEYIVDRTTIPWGPPYVGPPGGDAKFLFTSKACSTQGGTGLFDYLVWN